MMIEQDNDAQLEEVGPLIQALLDLSSDLVKKHGNFLPHGAMIDTFGNISLCGAAPENEITNSVEVLPMLHDGLRTSTQEFSTRAVAVSESVMIGSNQTSAIKVLVEHREGLTLAFYMPWKKRLIGGPKFDDIIIQPAEPEVGHWKQVVGF